VQLQEHSIHVSSNVGKISDHSMIAIGCFLLVCGVLLVLLVVFMLSLVRAM
jgi:hypothetical protein